MNPSSVPFERVRVHESSGIEEEDLRDCTLKDRIDQCCGNALEQLHYKREEEVQVESFVIYNYGASLGNTRN
jgi:hypothetical protein